MRPVVTAEQTIGATAAEFHTHTSARITRAGRTVGFVTVADCHAALRYGQSAAAIGLIAQADPGTARPGTAPQALQWADLGAQFDPALVQFLQQLTDICAQHAGRIFLVGGVVRALARPEVLTDLDVAVIGDFGVLITAIAAATGGTIVQRSAFQTATMTFPAALQALLGMVQYDLVAARSEAYAAVGALPSVEPVDDILVDLRRRDVTVSAMAVELLPRGPLPVFDPYGGWADLQAGRARLVHPLSFFEDPTRLIRLARIVARLHLRVDARLRALIDWAVTNGVCAHVSRFRWLQELQRTLDEGNPMPALQKLQQWGVLAAILPVARVSAADAALLKGMPATDRLVLVLWRLPPAALGAFIQEWTELPVWYRDLVAIRHSRRHWRVWLRRRPSRSIRALAGCAPAALATVALIEPLLAQLLAQHAIAQQQYPMRIKGGDLVAAGVPAGPRIRRGLEALQIHLWDAAWAGVPPCDSVAKQLRYAIQKSTTKQL